MFSISKRKESFYDILQISEDATVQEIKRSYKKLARENHPDIVANSDDDELKENAKKIMVKLNNAKDTLLDPTKRAEYDIILSESRGEGSISVEEYDGDYTSAEVFEIELDPDDEYNYGYEAYGHDNNYDTDQTDHKDEYDVDAQEHLAAEVEEELGTKYDDGTYSNANTSEILYPDQDETELEVSDLDQEQDVARIQRELFTFCPRCGAENLEMTDFCYNCNMRLIYYRQSHASARSSPPPPPPPPSGLNSEPTWITRSPKPGFITCPNCRANNYDDSEYCYFCNVNLRYYRGRVVRSRPAPPVRSRGSQPEPGMPLRDEELITCPDCGAGNFPSSIFCRICQYELSQNIKPGYHGPAKEKTRHDSENQYSSLVICPNCGAENFEDSTSCYFCHTSLVFYQPASTTDGPEVDTGPSKIKATATAPAQDSVTIECPKCEHEVFPEQTYCYYCGFAFPKYVKSKE